MTWNASFLAVLMMVAASLAQAQAVYRTVGPDGKIVFSDKPPVDANANISVTGKPKAPLPEQPGSRPVLANGTRANSPEAARAAAAAAASAAAEEDRKSGARRNQVIAETPARAAPPPPPAAGPAPPPDPALEKAVVAALAAENLISQMEDICIRTLPTSAKRYTVSDAWKQRNVALLNKMRMVLSDSFAGAQRVSINAAMKADVEKTLGPVDKAAPAARIKWCDKSADEVAAGVLDLGSKPAVAGPLAAYRLK